MEMDIRRDTDLPQQPSSDQKKMDKLIKIVFGTVVAVGIAAVFSPQSNTSSLVSRALAISTYTSVIISMAATMTVVVRLDEGPSFARWRRVLVLTSCGSLWSVTTLYLVSLNWRQVVAVPVALVIFFAAGRWPFVSSVVVVHHPDHDENAIKAVIFRRCDLFIGTSLVGVFFGTSFNDYMTKASRVPGAVVYIWISIYLVFTIGLFLMASIGTGLEALTDDYARKLYYVAAALLTVAFLLVVVVNCLRVSELPTS
ncbi:uncharacterized protein LOC127781672 isoform X2 [Oryza glaberrima]|uniref:uncharacterized protein LOC127781672 isoform X2 n=1 Tax=Oryza glaberrima TaxID=4538 RepID=UPI00224C5726|nr:uncharacterized protein LOC127781672 isoform X2 [Oryza glaberrima]